MGAEWHRELYGVAVSGGGDSMALLDLMHQLLPRQVQAATVDHGLRAASADEAALVGAHCAALGVAWTCLRPPHAIKGSVQAEARLARYALLERWRRDEGIGFLLTAHHADDQLETLVMRLNRASGVGGMAGIRRRQGRILRPLLDWRRAELAQWLHARSVPHVEDPSNADPRFDRARLRLQLGQQDWLDPLAATRSAAWLDQADQALDWMVGQAIARWPNAADPAIIRDEAYPDELFRRIILHRLLAHQPGLSVRGIALDGVMAAMRGGRRAMVGALLIDPASASAPTLWRISAAPRRKPDIK